MISLICRRGPRKYPGGKHRSGMEGCNIRGKKEKTPLKLNRSIFVTTDYSIPTLHGSLYISFAGAPLFHGLSVLPSVYPHVYVVTIGVSLEHNKQSVGG